MYIFLISDSSTTILADSPSTPIPSSTPTTSQRPVSQERNENHYKPATQSYDSTNEAYSESNKDEGTFAVLADSDVRILQTDDGKAVVIVDDDKKEDGRFRVTKETTFDINGYQSDEGAQIDAEFKRLPPLEIVSNEVLSELNVKQVLECNLPSNVTYSHWSKNGEVCRFPIIIISFLNVLRFRMNGCSMRPRYQIGVRMKCTKLAREAVKACGGVSFLNFRVLIKFCKRAPKVIERFREQYVRDVQKARDYFR